MKLIIGLQVDQQRRKKDFIVKMSDMDKSIGGLGDEVVEPQGK